MNEKEKMQFLARMIQKLEDHEDYTEDEEVTLQSIAYGLV